MRFLAVVLFIVLAWPTVAAADAKSRLLTAVRNVPELAVCFRGKRPKTVRIEIRIDKNGRVTRARAKSKGAVAQCVAGVIAVQKLSTRGAATVTVDIPTSDSSGSSGGGSIADIDADLRKHAAALNGCYAKVAKKRKNLKGRVVLRFLVKPNGKLLEPEVQSSTLNSLAVESCLIEQLLAIRVSERPGGKTMSMSFTLSFDGSSKSGAKMTTGDTSNQPQKRGPLAGKVIAQVMNGKKRAFSACYDKVARKKPSLAGKVVIRFTIRADGTVRNVKIRETSLNNAKVETCMVAVGKKLRFPGESGRDVTKVWYPFVFSQSAR